MKKLMEDVMEVKVDEQAPFLSSFKKPLEKLQREKQEKRELARTKKIVKSSSVEDKVFVRSPNSIVEVHRQRQAREGAAFAHHEGRCQDDERHRQLSTQSSRLMIRHQLCSAINIIGLLGVMQPFSRELVQQAIDGGFVDCCDFHEGSCLNTIIPHFLGTCASMYKMYIPIHIVPFLLFKRNKVMKQ